ncbi:hypothetical protein QBC37DRAFT_135585 [Rhypophila decipiens]|uniref:Uncharacterized protein n=1 Tax=Rhypophila decipiens TaxID=261697 RepID=A0AAN6YMH2_9PEZI|nr:hypothetical protein QBC37DRAFT_135585 [Rhypophila decipiens]
MPSQVPPINITVPASSRRTAGLPASQDLFASINATLASRTGQLVTPIHTIQENDYSVPAPPPPSPVGYRDYWPASMRR